MADEIYRSGKSKTQEEQLTEAIKDLTKTLKAEAKEHVKSVQGTEDLIDAQQDVSEVLKDKAELQKEENKETENSVIVRRKSLQALSDLYDAQGIEIKLIKDEIELQDKKSKNARDEIRQWELLNKNRALMITRQDAILDAYEDELEAQRLENKANAKVNSKLATLRRRYEKKEDADKAFSSFGNFLEATGANDLSITKIFQGVGDAISDPITAVKNGVVDLGQIVTQGFKSIGEKLDKSIDTAINLETNLMPGIDTRLAGLSNGYDNSVYKSGKYYEQIIQYSKYVNSTYYKTEEYMQSIASLVAKGIGNNLEQRAFLETVSDKLVTTFEVTSDQVTQLVRIQQKDVTLSQMGTEYLLTDLFNGVFGDTSYLTTLYDSVTASLLTASSLMDVDTATAFQYNVQKWLGALYESGMSSNAVQSIAQGLGYLGSGNVNALTGNSSLMTLVGLGASNAGLDIGQLLTQTISATQVDALMQGIIYTLQQIYANSDNAVVKSEFSRVLGIDTADLKAANNLSTSTISTLAGLSTNYNNSASAITGTIDKNLLNRTTEVERLSNLIDNSLLNLGASMANDWTAYTIYKIGKLFSGTAGTVLETAGLALGTLDGLFTGFEWTNVGNWGTLLSTNFKGTSLGRTIYGVLNNLGLYDLGGAEFDTSNEAGLFTALAQLFRDGAIADSTKFGSLLSDYYGISTSLPTGNYRNTEYYKNFNQVIASGNNPINYAGNIDTTSITGTAEEIVTEYSIQDLKDALWAQETAIGVRLQWFEERAIEQLKDTVVDAMGSYNGGTTLGSVVSQLQTMRYIG